MIRLAIRAQMEIMGLAVIVILVFLGLLFSVNLKKPDTSQETYATYATSELSNRYLVALLEAQTMDCTSENNMATPIRLKELAVDCARLWSMNGWREPFTTQVATYTCGDNNQNACDYLNKAIRSALDATLDEWEEYDYNLRFTLTHDGSSTDVISFNEGTCTTYSEAVASDGFYPLSLYKTVEGAGSLTLRLCTP